MVTVIPYAQEAELVALLGDGGCALAGSVWTADLDRGLGLARRLQAGPLRVNGRLPEPAGPDCLDAYLRPSAVFLPEPAAVS